MFHSATHSEKPVLTRILKRSFEPDRSTVKKKEMHRRCKDVAFLGVWTAKQSSIPFQDKSLMRGMTKVMIVDELDGVPRPVGL
ncbi:hypothetical protein TNCV_3885821 [Trichonephila clavipes]|nr:hypothetical protein TNCV_3885821 [Trichonephila clavipes]